ncbi:MAG: glycosyltransferase [Eubacteriales bacterium]|nr:glycosyltransferase [Eubacteriales bacterium]
MLISICIPCYRSENNLEWVVNEIKEEFNKHPSHDYQLVLVNDGSPDHTFDVIRRLCEADPKIKGINLTKNQGQPCARLAAANHADGDALVFMDDDGQHPPEAIFRMVDKIREGYDIVYAKFPKTTHKWSKRVTSEMYNKLMQATGTKPKDVSTSSFAAWSRVVIDAIKNYKSPFPSAGAYLRCVTDKLANVNVEHRSRHSGSSGYSFRRLVSQSMNSLTNFSMVPLRAASFLGVLTAMIGFVFGIVTIVRKIIHPEMIAGYASTIAILLFIGGVIMLILGLIGEYIGRIYMTLSNKPQYVIAEIINGRESDEKS